MNTFLLLLGTIFFQIFQVHFLSLLNKFKISSTPAVGAIFSCIGRNHVGIVIGWDGTNITIQEGNLDGKTNSFAEAKKDWHTVAYTLSQFVSICHGVEFAIPI